MYSDDDLYDGFNNVERELFAYVMNFGNIKDDIIKIISSDDNMLKSYLKDENKFINDIIIKGKEVYKY